MRKKIFSYLSLIAVLTAMSLSSCGNDDELTDLDKADDAMPLTVIVSINSSSTIATRAFYEDDGWSLKDTFQDGDVLGFYSKSGNSEDNDGKGPFVNAPLTRESTTNKGDIFRGEGMTISPGNLKATEVYLYSPYDANAATGLELRRKKSGDDTPRCVDFLEAIGVNADNLNQGSLSATFLHSLSELVIMRGDGFDNPPASIGEDRWKVTITMKNGYSHLKINNTQSPWACTPELIYQNGYSMSKEECRVWPTWQGKFSSTKDNLEGVDAWFVILPTIGTKNKRESVDYIELYDNNGTLQKVSSLKLSGGNTKMLDGGQRYPMTIVMSELGPTINPFPIIPWNGDEDITNSRAERGIANLGDFTNWLNAYNSYLLDKKSEEKQNALFTYGDKVDGVWHFYILADIDFKNYNGSAPIINKLEDVIDGISSSLEGYTFQNHTLSNLPASLVGTLYDNGCLQNIDLKLPTIQSTATAPVGVLANTIDGGTITNCNINNGGLVSRGPVGIIAGTISNGTVEQCTVSGMLIGSASNASSGYMFGTVSGSNTVQNNYSNVTFRSLTEEETEDDTP